jgi:hypothetical protein
MKTTIEVELQPFQTPNFVRVKGKIGGMQETHCYPLSFLDPYTLEKLCDQFRAEVFRKAGKPQTKVTPASDSDQAAEDAEQLFEKIQKGFEGRVRHRPTLSTNQDDKRLRR